MYVGKISRVSMINCLFACDLISRIGVLAFDTNVVLRISEICLLIRIGVLFGIAKTELAKVVALNVRPMAKARLARFFIVFPLSTPVDSNVDSLIILSVPLYLLS